MKLVHPPLLRPLPSGLVNAVATLGPLGSRLPAPGTWGSVAGLLFYLLFFQRLPLAAYLVACACGLVLAVLFCGEAELRLGKRDPGMIILDEFVVMPLCFLGAHAVLRVWPLWAMCLAGFALFRFFDILKPLGISRLQRLPAGWGVVADDLAAALAACLALHLLAHFWQPF